MSEAFLIENGCRFYGCSAALRLADRLSGLHLHPPASAHAHAVRSSLHGYAAYAAAAQAILADLELSGGTWVMKDPRLCLLLPIWRAQLQLAGHSGAEKGPGVGSLDAAKGSSLLSVIMVRRLL